MRALVVGLALCLGGCGIEAPKAVPEKPAPEKKAAKELPTRQQMKARLMGKGKADVMRQLGRPDRTRETPSGGESWEYERGMTRDPTSGRDDERLSVWFDPSGRVGTVEF